MPPSVTRDLDYLAARLHGRCSRLAEGRVLDDLCRIRTVAELARRLTPGQPCERGAELQRRLVRMMIDELGELGQNLTGAGRRLLLWLRVRYQVETLKVVIRGVVNDVPLPTLRAQLADLPSDLALPIASLEASRDASPLDRLAGIAPPGPLQQGLLAAAGAYRERARPVVLELALDCAYLGQLRVLTDGLGEPERGEAATLAALELDVHNLMLVLRGRHHYHLPAGELRAWHVPGGRWDASSFDALLSAPDLAAALEVGGQRQFPGAPVPVDPEAFEARLWNRAFARAHAVFRRRHMRLGAVIGYAAIRRIELVNLITLTEGLRLGLEPLRIRERLIPRPTGESDHV